MVNGPVDPSGPQAGDIRETYEIDLDDTVDHGAPSVGHWRTAVRGERQLLSMRLPGGKAVRVSIVMAGLAVLAGAVSLVRQYLPGPQAPVVDARHIDSMDLGPMAIGPLSGADGRPAGPVTVTIPVRIDVTRMPTGNKGDLQVLGVLGPGLSTPTAPDLTAAPGKPLDGAIVTSVDCPNVPASASGPAYRLLVRVSGSSEAFHGEIPAGRLGDWLAAQVPAVCDQWLVGRDLTVTTASLTSPDSRGPIELTLTVVNHSSRTARMTTPVGDLLQSGQSGRQSRSAEVRVPPGSGPVRVTLSSRVCETQDLLLGSPDVVSHANTQILLAIGATFDSADGDHGLGPVGVVMTPDARQAVIQARHVLCAGQPARAGAGAP